MAEIPPIPGFRNLRPLGSGAFADVFSADDESVSRRVAIKLLRERTPNAAQLDRFRRERETLATLNHPHVLRVHTAGSVRGRPYVVTELLPGRTLGDLLKEAQRGGEDREQLLDLLHQAALGVAALHAVGLAHRDIKPENLLIDEEGKVKVADLGLVGGADLRSLTADGAVIGTPAYLAPEMCRGVGTREPTCDVYSLGATLFEVLTGQIPHPAPTVATLLLRRLGAPNPDPREVLPSVPGALADLCRRSMEFEPADRYPDARAFAEALTLARSAPLASPLDSPRLARRILIATLLFAVAVLGLLPWLLPPPALPPGPSRSPLFAGASPTPTAAPSPTPVSARDPSLAGLEARLRERSPGAGAAAARWIAAHPRHREGPERLREAARLGRLLGPPSFEHKRDFANRSHPVYLRHLASGETLWIERCVTLCSRRHASPSPLVAISPDGTSRPLPWTGDHVTAMAPDDTYWATADESGESHVLRRSGTTWSSFAQLPLRCGALLADSERVVCGLDDGRVLCLAADTGEVLWTQVVHRTAVRGLAWWGMDVASYAHDESQPLALLAKHSGAARAWGFDLPPLGAVRWGLSVPAGPKWSAELVVCLDRTSAIHGLRAEAPNRTFSGARAFNTARSMPLAGPFSPDGTTPRSATSIGALLVIVGSQRIAGQIDSELRVFHLRHGREVAAKLQPKVDFTTTSYAERQRVFFVAGVQGGRATLRAWDLALPELDDL